MFRPPSPSAAKPVAMPATTVSGWTNTNAVRQLRQATAKAIQNNRSRGRSGTRLWARCTAASCWRRARLSRTTSRCRGAATPASDNHHKRLQHGAIVTGMVQFNSGGVLAMVSIRKPAVSRSLSP
jgi:hypothetical protein